MELHRKLLHRVGWWGNALSPALPQITSQQGNFQASRCSRKRIE